METRSGMSEYHLPLRLNSLTNMRCHWSVKHKQARAHRDACIIIKKHPLPCTVEIIRIGKRLLDKDDNLPASIKSLKDGIAARLGVDDADPRITWKYSQQIGDYSAIVRISDANEA